MSTQSLQMNFNVVNDDPLRQELQKAQAYINALNVEIVALETTNTSLQAKVTDLTTRMVAVEKYIAAHP